MREGMRWWDEKWKDWGRGEAENCVCYLSPSVDAWSLYCFRWISWEENQDVRNSVPPKEHNRGLEPSLVSQWKTRMKNAQGFDKERDTNNMRLKALFPNMVRGRYWSWGLWIWRNRLQRTHPCHTIRLATWCLCQFFPFAWMNEQRLFSLQFRK